MEAQTHQLQAETTQGIAAQVSTDLMRGERAAEGIVTALEGLHAAGVVDRAVYDATIRQFLENNTNLLGAWSGWEPNTLDNSDGAAVGKPGHDATGRYISLGVQPNAADTNALACKSVVS